MGNLVSRLLGNVSTRIMLIIYLMLILITGFFIAFGYFNQLSLQEEKQYDKLTAIVSSSALQLDGDSHRALFSNYLEKDAIKSHDENPEYLKIQQILARVQEANKLESPLYTLVYDSKKDVFYYGVRSDEQTYYRHEYVQYAPELLEKMDVGGVVPKYMSENGTWLSAFHPIVSSNGETVALLQADIAFSKFTEEVNSRYLKQAIIALLVIIAFAFLLLPYTQKVLRHEAKQNKMILQQKNLIEQKNKDITDSINYAKRIQEAILPSESFRKKQFENSFVLYRPKDIVAGDFYWIPETAGYSLIAAADCTGHGVPGAMVSVVCNNALNRAVREYGLWKPNEILDKTTELVIEAFELDDSTVRDGMDISLCVFNEDKSKLWFSGAYNGLFFIRDGQCSEIKANKQPIGKYANLKPFDCQEIDLLPGDLIYMSTDGYPDQFGGEKGKKLKSKNFKALIKKNHTKSLSEQEKILNSAFEEWMGDFEQLDDVCVIGIKI